MPIARTKRGIVSRLLCGPSIVLIVVSACGRDPTPAAPAPADAAQAEANEIRELLAYAIVGAHWESGSGSRRGHNIGAVLAAPDGTPVWWALNADFAADSSLEHAEARVIRGYIAHRRAVGQPLERLSGYTVYTTLEPCAMCAGTMIMANVARVVYGQRDFRWGGAIERLALDSRRIERGFAPYPRGVEPMSSHSSFRTRLERAYRRSGEGSVTRWLDSAEASDIFHEAARAFGEYQLHHPENAGMLEKAREVYQNALAAGSSLNR